MKKTIHSFLRSIHYTIWLALLTLLVVTTIFPVAAQANFRFWILDFRLGHEQAHNSFSLPNHLLPTTVRLTLTEAHYPFPIDPKSKIQNPKSTNPKSTASTLLEQGTTLYNSGRFSEAAAIWQQAIKEFEAQGDRIQVALTLSYLSNAYQELGQWQAATAAITKSFNLIQNSALDPKHSALIQAQILNTQGSLQLAMGQTEAALKTWQLAEKAYAEAGDETGRLGSQINQAQALQTLGLYRSAQTTLEQVNQTLKAWPDSLLKATGLRSLGLALQVVGDLGRSQVVLQQSLAIAQQFNSPADINTTLFSLGNTARALQKPEALGLYQKAAETATTAIAKLEAQLNQLSLLVETKKWAEANTLLPEIQAAIANLSPSRDAVYARVNFAQSLLAIAEEQGRLTNAPEIARLLATAVQQAKQLQDPRAQSYALNELGRLYQQTGQLADAQNLTQQALILAQGIRADDIVARTQAQQGQLFKQQGEIERAIAAYTEAVNTLQSLRNELVAINPDVQFSFRDSVEPIYRELVGLLLLDTRSPQPPLPRGALDSTSELPLGKGGQGGIVPKTKTSEPPLGKGGQGGIVPKTKTSEPPLDKGGQGGIVPKTKTSEPPLGKGGQGGIVPKTKTSEPPLGKGGQGGSAPKTKTSEPSLDKGGQGGSAPSQQNLKQAREVIEALQLAELDNFFREACLNVKPQQIDQIDPTAAVIYPIILPDRLEVIFSLPGQPLRHYATGLPQRDVEKTLNELLESLNPLFSRQARLRLSQQVYDWLIKPAEAELTANNIKTLVFVPDGFLRNLPMAALYDGKQYLIEKYSIALTPGLQLLGARSLVPKQLKILTGGLTEARQGFSALPGVEFEVQQIASEVPSKIFLNQQFTETNLQNQIAATSFPIVHLATHGQFSSSPEQTFILTWDEKIKAKEFEDLLQSREQTRPNPIELLVLSACQTAAGDKRAALGLAGIAVRSGARSTVATLWSVKDQSTAKLMIEFYQQLSQGVGKAQALRTAQLHLLEQPNFQHPFYWAPFILVGNWL